MRKRIAIIQGHPDATALHLGHALADGYAQGAAEADHRVDRLEVALLDFPLLRTAADWNTGVLSASLHDAQAAIGRADHLVILFPLWAGTMPALCKGFFEQVMRPGFAFRRNDSGGPERPALGGKSARLVVTMGMPAFAYRWFYFAHGVKGFERSLLKFCGVGPIRTTYIGGVDTPGFAGEAWIDRLRELGRRGD